MKHVRSSQLEKCIVKHFDEYMDDVRAALNDPNAVVNPNGGCETVGTYDLCRQLAAYYGVRTVTRIHVDSSEYIGIRIVWIAYKENESHA